MLGTVQFADPFDDHAARACTFDFRAHLVEKVGEIANFRLLRCAFNHGGAFGENRGHHHVIGAKNGRPEFAAQINHRAIQFRRENLHVSAFYSHRCAKSLETFQMQVDRPVADDTPARQRNSRFLATPEKRSKHANGRAHFSNDFIWCNRLSLVCGNCDGAARAFHLCAEMVENLQHVVRVAQVGHAMNGTRLARQQRRSQDGQSGILRAADLDGTSERIPAMHKNLIHTGRKENALYLNNRFSPRCRRNFSGARVRSGPVPDPDQSRARGDCRHANVPARFQSIGE